MRHNDESSLARRDRDPGITPWDEFQGASGFFSGSPWQMMRRMQEDMDRMFGQFVGGTGTGNVGQVMPAWQQWTPSIDISQTGNEWTIEADLPGVSRDNVEVKVENHTLRLRAEMRQEEKEDDAKRQYHRRERRFGHFERVFPLPENVNENAISCEFRNGLLSVHVPKTAQAQAPSRRINISETSAQPTVGRGDGTPPSASRMHGGSHAGAHDEDEEPATAGRR